MPPPQIKIVMELPNLFPKVNMSHLTAVVAPSHFAALHPSVQSSLSSASPPPSLHVINPGVDTSLFNPDGPTQCSSACRTGNRPHQPLQASNLSKCRTACITVGFVGRISSEKSPGLFIKMAKIINSKHPFVRFIVVGDGKFLQPMMEEASISGISHVVDFMGAKYGEELIEVRALCTEWTGCTICTVYSVYGLRRKTCSPLVQLFPFHPSSSISQPHPNILPPPHHADNARPGCFHRNKLAF